MGKHTKHGKTTTRQSEIDKATHDKIAYEVEQDALFLRKLQKHIEKQKQRQAIEFQKWLDKHVPDTVEEYHDKWKNHKSKIPMVSYNKTVAI